MISEELDKEGIKINGGAIGILTISILNSRITNTYWLVYIDDIILIISGVLIIVRLCAEVNENWAIFFEGTIH